MSPVYTLGGFCRNPPSRGIDIRWITAKSRLIHPTIIQKFINIPVILQTQKSIIEKLWNGQRKYM